MQSIKNTQLLQKNGITALSFSKNGLYCAIATKKIFKVYIFQIKTLNDINSWKILQQIKEHGQTISDIDWSLDQKILTVSHDRSIYAWKKNKDIWDKMFVKIDCKLAVMTCKWAPCCKKFALGSCPNTLVVGFYNSEIQGWAGIMKEKICKSPIVSLDFHPSSKVLALGEVSGNIKIVSCSFKKNIQLQKLQDFPYNGPFQKIESLCQVLYSIDNLFQNMNTWINHVSFENNGKKLLVIPHSGHIKLFDVIEGQKILTNQIDVSYNGLPFLNGMFNAQKNQLILAGFDQKVALFNQQRQSFKFNKFLETNEKSNKKKMKGIVEMFTKGIQKKQWQFGDHPKQQEHKNSIKVLKTRGIYVSYDLNGVIHFWQ